MEDVLNHLESYATVTFNPELQTLVRMSVWACGLEFKVAKGASVLILGYRWPSALKPPNKPGAQNGAWGG